MPTPTVSVVVPVYRVEKYLDKCVGSICAQTFADFELILVDDGSPDNCPALCDAWAQKDSRIRVIHQKNGGLSAARNAGIEAALGQYLLFVDSDDYIESDMLRQLVCAAQRSGSKMTLCNLRYEDELGIPFLYPDFSSVQDAILDRNAFWNGYYSSQSAYYVVAWNKLYRRELFTSLRYPVGKLHEDEYVLQELVDQCDNICCLGYIGYHYVQRSGSITNSAKNVDHLEYWEILLLRAERFCGSGDFLRAEGMLQSVILGLWKRQPDFTRTPDLARSFRAVVGECSQFYLRLARKTGQKSMLFRAFLLRLGLTQYIRFLQKRNPELFDGRDQSNAELTEFQNDLTSAGDCPRRFILMQTPLHGNLGDHAIALAELNFLAEHFPDVPVVELPGFAFSRQPEAYASLLNAEKDTILITGGGFAGSLWQEEESNIQCILSELHGFRILMLPQTLYYEDESSPEALSSIHGYASCQTLTFCARESLTLDRLNRLLPNTRSELIPDMVLYSQYTETSKPRCGIGLCLRQDKESTLDADERKALATGILHSFPSDSPVWTDTVIPQDVSPAKRRETVLAKLDEFAGYRFIITDRLHGMVFAALTGTPCIVLDNCDHKVQGVYDWLKQNRYILYLDNAAALPSALQKIEPMLSVRHKCDFSSVRAGFDRLAELLQ